MFKKGSGEENTVTALSLSNTAEEASLSWYTVDTEQFLLLSCHIFPLYLLS